MTRDLSLHHLSRLSASPAELAVAAAAAGFSHVGLRIVPVSDEEVFDLVHDVAARRATRRLLDDLGIGVLDTEAVWLRPETDVDALVPALEATRDLGARSVLTVGMDEDRQRLIDRLGRLADLADGFGLTVALESITYSSVPDLLDARTVADAVARSNVRLLVDSLQLFRSRVALHEVAAVPRSLLPYAQISDAPATAPKTIGARRDEARHDRLVPGTGDLDLIGLLHALPADVPLAVECPSRILDRMPLPEAATALAHAISRLVELAEQTTSPMEGIPHA